MTQIINGPGNPLPIPQYLYPTELAPPGNPADQASNYFMLNAGDALAIPAGRWWVSTGPAGLLQYLDPVTGIWRGFAPIHGQPQVVFSDGFTRRVANLTGCPVAAVVANGGSSYTQSTCTVTSNTGSSTWQPIVGGSLSYTSMSADGSGFTMAPLVFVPAPPPANSANAPAPNVSTAPLGGYGGVQATAHAVLTGTSVTSIVFDNVGAGYTVAPTVTILPNPTDPNYINVTAATAVIALANSGKITAVLCTNPGGPLATISALTLTAAGGAGTSATITPVIMQTVTATSVIAAGAGLGLSGDPVKIMSVGGVPASVSAIGNPAIELTGFAPRSFDGTATTGAGGTLSTGAIAATYDSGLFLGTPTPVIVPGAAGAGTPTLASITFMMGNTTDTILMQPL